MNKFLKVFFLKSLGTIDLLCVASLDISGLFQRIYCTTRPLWEHPGQVSEISAKRR